MNLSVLIPSVHTRRNTFLPTISERIYSLYEALSEDQQGEVEILILCDNKKMMLGEKRNVMMDMAQGDYITFVDDDDRISDDYLVELLKAIDYRKDVITFHVEVSINGEKPKICHYSKDYEKDHNRKNTYYRLPNHICCINRYIATQISFPSIPKGEDSAFSKLLKPLLETEHKIEKVLYYYDYNDDTTETQNDLVQKIRKRKNNSAPIVDVVFLSKGYDAKMVSTTQHAIDSCVSGANGLPINIIVLEQMLNVSYEHANTIHVDEPFNYNKFANFGASQGNSEWIMIANNDLKFRNGWLHKLLEADHPVVSPKCPKDIRQKEITKNKKGFTNAVNFSGWCFMIKREIWEKINGFDEGFAFWCADDSVIEQLRAIEIAPMIVPSALVEHLGSQTLKILDKENKDDFTWRQIYKFNEKYGKSKFENNTHYKKWKSQFA